MGQFDNSKIVTQELSKNRLCIDCPRSLNGSGRTGGVGDDTAGRGKEMHKGRSASVGRSHSRPNLLRAPSGSETADMEKCMAENTVLHDIHPLGPVRREFEDFAFRKAPKLFILSIAAEPKLLKDTEVTNDHLKTVVSLMRSKMDPENTMVLVVPHPWSEFLTRLEEAVRDVRMGLVAEDHPLLLVYKKVRGGLPPSLRRQALRTTSRATSTRFFSHTPTGLRSPAIKESPSTTPLATGLMHVFRCPKPCATLSTTVLKTGIPMRTLHFLINRFTNVGDTVISFSTERHNVVEGALERSRRVEVFVSNAQSKDEVRDSTQDLFHPSVQGRQVEGIHFSRRRTRDILFVSSISVGANARPHSGATIFC